MRIAVIHKPYFYPWMGYFSKLALAQVFVVQDNVLASNRVWINRSRIIRPDGQPGYITLPIGRKGDAIISTIELTSKERESTARRIAMSVEHAYARSRHFTEWKVLKVRFLDTIHQYTRLLDIDVEIIIHMLDYLCLPIPKIHFASNLRCSNDPLSTLIANCQDTECNALFIGGGNSEWKSEDSDRLQEAQITPLMHDYYAKHPEYYQTRRERLGFCRGLSILDCILNEGREKTVGLLKEVQYESITKM